MKAAKKSRWKTLRCVVEYRTQSDLSEHDLASHVQYLSDTFAENATSFRESKLWAKGFTRTLATMEAARPKKLLAAIRALDAAVARLRKL